MCDDLFHIFWTHVWKKFIVEVCFFCLKYRQISIEIYQNLKFLVFCRNFCQNVDFESKNLNNHACEFDDEHIFGKLGCDSIKWYTFGYVFDPQRLWNTDLFFRSLLNMKKKALAAPLPYGGKGNGSRLRPLVL